MGRWLDAILASDAPAATADGVVEELSTDLARSLGEYDPFTLCEVLRIALLPFTVGGKVRPGTERGPTEVELLMLLALVGPGAVPVARKTRADPNPEVQDWKKKCRDLLDVLQIELIARAKLADDPALAKIQFATSLRELWLRNSSYPEIVGATLLELFGEPETEATLRGALGFTAAEAVTVLDAVHDTQVLRWNRRMEAGFPALNELTEAAQEKGSTDPAGPEAQRFREVWASIWSPDRSEVAVTPQDASDVCGVPLEIAALVFAAFRLEPPDLRPADLARAFVVGDNPWRTKPLLVGEDGAGMLVHHALNLQAVRETCERILRETSRWDAYQAHRGKLLEDRVREIFETLMPGSAIRAGYEYFVPANAAEAGGGAEGFTKRVEGDLLVVLDDVAVVVECKAIAVNPKARAGDTGKLRRDLVGMIRNASAQACRAAERIRLDGGLRVQSEGWVDLSAVREIHLVAVSLEDLPGVATATAGLIDAGFLDPDAVPWTVSLHDLQLISDLAGTPAEFLLYLRRRRDAETTRYYEAPDELDYYLYFLERGLYVPPDPDKVHAELPFMKPDTAARRRRRNLRPSVITSRTDPLDAWHLSRIDPSMPPAPKPQLEHAPIKEFVQELARRRDYGWLSIGATLLSMSAKDQMQMAREPSHLLSKADPVGGERSVTVPIGTSRENAWLLVWITRPAGRPPGDAENHARGYLRAKKYQLGITRGAAFEFSEQTKLLDGVFYDGALPSPDPELDQLVKQLLPPEGLQHRPPPGAKRTGKRR
ncbi:MAG: hypothetical protein LBK95_08315 [Bifidobacteriaceae bacterium]|nr:hypothetical protein [Bifidobacteriaceae bacterium]